MLTNYLKLAWRMLLRRKFFTFISLFGISFTLMVLLVAMSLVDHTTGPHAPELRTDRLLYVNALRLVGKGGWINQSGASLTFYRRYVQTLRTPEKVALFGNMSSMTGLAGDQTLTLDVAYADGNFWQVTDFQFLDGRPFTNAEADRGDRICVVNASTARKFFGEVRGVVGRTIELGPRRYRVVGVVPNVPALRFCSSADVWAPYRLASESWGGGPMELFGSFIPILLARSPEQVPAVQAEFAAVMRRVPVPHPEQTERLAAFADSQLAGLVRQITGRDRSATDNGMGLFLAVCAGLALLFMLLPALNLMNLSVTRTLERASEIGVRKAFGASGRTLVGQFLVENLVLTVLGALLGLALAAGALALLNESAVFAYADFFLDWRAFGWALGLALVFSLLSGVYPAWRLSRLHPVDALRNTGGGPQ